MAEFYQAGDLTRADQVIPDGLVSDSMSGGAKTVFKSGFGDMGLSISQLVWGLSCF